MDISLKRCPFYDRLQACTGRVPRIDFYQFPSARKTDLKSVIKKTPFKKKSILRNFTQIYPIHPFNNVCVLAHEHYYISCYISIENIPMIGAGAGGQLLFKDMS
jgi:hypothetical protein